MKKAAVILSILIAFTVISCMIFYEAGPWLMVQDPIPAQADFIFTFGGDPDRYIFAQGLAQKQPDAFWIISTGWFPVFDTLRLCHIVRRTIANKGMDTARIIINDTCTSTGSEIKILADYLETAMNRRVSMPVPPVSDYDSISLDDKNRIASWFSVRPLKDSLDCILVSNIFHTRRIKMWAERNFKGLPVRIYMVSQPHLNGSDKPGWKWWKNEKDAEFILLEYVKIAYYFTLRGLIGQN